MDVIYLQQEESLCGRTWCEDRINNNDEKYVHIDAVKKRFENVINGKSLEIPRKIIKNIIKELEDL